MVVQAIIGYIERVIIVNFKNFREGTGQGAVELALRCEVVARAVRVPIIAAVSAFDLYRVKNAVSMPVWVQHVDGAGYGPYTGWLLAETAKQMGADGTLLNHSEHKLLADELRTAVMRCRETGLKVCICADSIDEAQRVADLEPELVAYEPPELVGNTSRSVSSEKGAIVRELVRRLEGQAVLIGAGVHSEEDVRAGLALGARGVLVANAVVTALEPEIKLAELAGGFGLK